MPIQNVRDFARAIQQVGQLRTQERWADAIPLARECVAYLIGDHGPNHPSVANATRTVAELEEQAGQRDAAEANFVKASEIWRTAMGERHCSYANSLVRLGAFHEAGGDLLKAETLYAQAVEILDAVVGVEHADAQTARARLTECRRRIVEKSSALSKGLGQLAFIESITGAEKETDRRFGIIDLAREVLEKRAAKEREPETPAEVAPAPLPVELPTWKTVRVFLSSTFRDMHAERDHLVKVTFPRLREWCQARRLHLVDIDLRWGVTREEAEHGKAIEICLKEIDGSRPFFVCLLGSRYGWVPRDLPPEETYGFREQVESGRSITHLEILHATGESMHLDAGKRQPPCRHSFFYFRKPGCVPETPELAGFFEQDPRLARALADLKQSIRDHFPVREYAGVWDPTAENPEDPSLRGRLSRLDQFGDYVQADLEAAISEQFAAHVAALGESHPLAEERSFHDAFLETRTRVHVPREEIERAITRYIEGDDRRALIVSGPAGSGKSATLAHWIREFLGDPPRQEPFVLARFIGASAASTNLTRLLRNLCAELINHFQLTEPREKDEREDQPLRPMQVPADPRRLLERWPDVLKAAAGKGHVVIALDGLNQLDRSADPERAGWLTQPLPEGVRIIASVLDHGPDASSQTDWLVSLRRCRLPELAVEPLSDADSRRLIAALPSVFCKTLDESQVAMLLENRATRNPLFLTVALEELRIFGSFEKLQEAIRSLPRLEDPGIDGDVGRAAEAMFARVLDRLDRETGLARPLFELIASSRDGLSERELDELLARRLPALEPSGRRGAAQIVLRQMRPYLSRKGTPSGALVDFYHRTLWKAVRAHYLAEDPAQRAAHRELASYFSGQPNYLAEGPNARRAAELPWQLLAGGEWASLEQPLCDMEFVAAKCEAGLVYDLQLDYQSALNSWPGHRAHDPFAPPGDADEVLAAMRRAETAAAACEDTPLGRIQEFAAFVTGHCHLLAQNPAETLVIARNHASTGIVAERAEALLEGRNRAWVSRDPRPPAQPPLPLCIRTLAADKDAGPVSSLAISADGRVAAFGRGGGFIEVWDMATGIRRHRLAGHQNDAHSLAMSADGRMLISASRAAGLMSRLLELTGTGAGSTSQDTSVRQWDLETGTEVRRIDIEASEVAISSDGRFAVLAGGGQTIRVWNLSTGGFERTIAKTGGDALRVALARDAKIAVTADSERAVRIWDLESGACRAGLTGHGEEIHSVAISADGTLAASASGLAIASEDNVVRLWDTAAGTCRRVLTGHTRPVQSVALSADGRIAVSASADQRIKVWDTRTGECIRTIRGPAEFGALAITDSARTAVTELRLWNLEGQASTELPGHEPVAGESDMALPGGMAVAAEQQKTLVEFLDRDVNAIALTADGSLAVSAGSDGTARVWDAATGESRNVLRGHVFHVNDVALTPEGLAVTAGADNTLRFWDPASGRCLRILQGHTGGAHGVAAAVDGRALVSCASGMGQKEQADHTVRLWNLATGRNLRVFKGHSHWVTSVAVTPDGQTAISGSTDDTIRLWDLASGDAKRTIATTMGQVHRLVVTPDGAYVAAATRFGQTGVWDLKTGRRIRILGERGGTARCVGTSADGRIIVTGGDDGVLQFWRIEDGARIAMYDADSPVTAVSNIRPDGRLACGAKDGQVHLLTLRGVEQEAAIVTAAKRYHFDLRTQDGETPGAYDSCASWQCQQCGKLNPANTNSCEACGQTVRQNPFVVDELNFAGIDWHSDAELQGRFHPDAVDDVEVVIHDGHPGMSGRTPERAWVRIYDKRGRVYRGTLLNQPFTLTTVSKGDDVLFVAPPGCQYLIRVSEQYLAERDNWDIQPCNQCGLTETFDPPSEMLKNTQVPPEYHAQVPQITAPCPLCPGTQILLRKGAQPPSPPPATPAPQKTSWWKRLRQGA